MKTVLIPSDKCSEAAALIKRGGLVVFPTETVYGLGASAFNPVACTRIFTAKSRPSDNPLIVHIADREQLSQVAVDIPEMAIKLMDAFWPGPLSLILPKAATLPEIVTAGLTTVAVRLPSDPQARDFLRQCEVPVAAPSANVSGQPSPTNFEMAKAAMSGRVEGILQGEDALTGLESTIVGFPGGEPKIYRPGSVTGEMIAEVLGVSVDSLVNLPIPADSRPLSPGQKYTHYKPLATVQLFRSWEEIRGSFSVNQKIGVLAVPAWDGLPEQWEKRFFPTWEEYARRLYSSFFELDNLCCTLIFAQIPEEKGIGRALVNRLSKAAGVKL